MCECVCSTLVAGHVSCGARQNALVGIHETSPWGDDNLADGVFIKIFFQFQK